MKTNEDKLTFEGFVLKFIDETMKIESVNFESQYINAKCNSKNKICEFLEGEILNGGYGKIEVEIQKPTVNKELYQPRVRKLKVIPVSTKFNDNEFQVQLKIASEFYY